MFRLQASFIKNIGLQLKDEASLCIEFTFVLLRNVVLNGFMLLDNNGFMSL